MSALIAGRLHENFTLTGKLTGELVKLGHPGTTVNVNLFADPRFLELQAALVRVLARHPEARADVLRAFKELDQRAAPSPALAAPAPEIIDVEPVAG